MNQNKKTKTVISIKSKIKKKLEDALSSHNTIDDNRFMRLETDIKNLDLIQWLKNQTGEIKTYWRDRESKFEMAGLGEADVISGSLMPDYRALFLRLKEYLLNTDQAVRYYGGMRFNKKHSSDFKWQAFTSYRFIVPKFEILRIGTSTTFACNILVHAGENFSKLIERTQKELDTINFDYPEKSDVWPQVIERSDFPDYEENV